MAEEPSLREDPGATSPVRPGDVLDGKYRVERVIGRGGMGIVVAARHLHLGERVAVKLLLPALSARRDAAARFLREGRAAARIRSEHVARVYDAGTLASGALYLVLELLRGRDLRAEVAARGPLSVEEAVSHVAQACEGLASAHALGVVHRDLKPANLFLTERPDGSPAVKIIDFGVAKVLVGDVAESADTEPDRLTGSGLAVGTPCYMAPEQMRAARDADVRADVFSLGATLFGLLAGAPPFSGDTMVAVYDRILAGPPSLRARRPEIPAALDAVIARCMQVRPEDRYPDVAELARALAGFGGAAAALAAERAERIRANRRVDVTAADGGADGDTESSPGADDAEDPTDAPRDLSWLSGEPTSPAAEDDGGLSGEPTSPAAEDDGAPPRAVPATPSARGPENAVAAPWAYRRPLRVVVAAVVAVLAVLVAVVLWPADEPEDPSPPTPAVSDQGRPAAVTAASVRPKTTAPAVSSPPNTASVESPPAAGAQGTGRARGRPPASSATATAAPTPWSPGPMDLPD